MTILVKILQFVLSLTILVIIHELGHFFFAKLFKTRVEKFYLFFNPWFSLFKFRKGETEYGIGWLPLGGYVKISGMIDESLDREQMNKLPEPWEFRTKPSWQRLLIMTGGVFFNFILAFLIYVMVLYAWGVTYLPNANVKYGIVTDSTGFAMGLRNGDKILSVDNRQIDNFYEINKEIILRKDATIQIQRDSQTLELNVTQDYIRNAIRGKGRIEPRVPFSPFIINGFGKVSPARDAGLLEGDEIVEADNLRFTYFDEFQNYLIQNRGREIMLGVLRNGQTLKIPVKPSINGRLEIMRSYENIFEYKTVKYGFLESIPQGLKMGIGTIEDYLKQFRLIFSKGTKAHESLGGFITIGNIFPGKWNWQAFWNLTAFLSIILAVMNILPIPALDGGHVMFLFYEVVTGRKPSDKFLEYAQIAGMILLFALLIYANGNDIIKLIKK
ncbi:MAG: RIP metalloprotease RseP [Bacteroidales bacterium]|nr:RIP metalloprotease RseP [Bacteroidales bacterium]